MKKKPVIKIYGVLGYPVKHSLSPLMHNAALRKLKIKAEYRFFEKKPDELPGFLRSLSQKNIYGLNVTIPYKERVMPFLDEISKEAKLIGAVNTIKVLRKKLKGFNTDGEGFFTHLTKDLKFNPKGKVVALIGAGGAAKAVAVYLSRAKAKRISIYDAEGSRTIALFSHLRANFSNIEFKACNSVDALDIGECDLLINATPVGMRETDPLLTGERLLHKNLLVYDLIYNPAETRLLKIAKLKGARVSNGLGMLLNQGMLSFEIWTGKKAPKQVMENALLKALP